MTEQEKKIYSTVENAVTETVDFTEEHYDLISKMNGLYEKKLTKYMNSRIVVEFNFLEWLKRQTVGIETKDEFKRLMDTIIATIKTKKDRTKIENYELKLCYEIYKDVVNGNGERYEVFDDKVKVNYDDQQVEFEAFLNRKQEQVQ